MKKVHIKDLCELRYGKSLKKANRKGGTVPVYGSNGIVGYHNKPLVKKKTIIIGRKGSIGEVHFVEIPSWPIDTTYFVELKDREISLEWFYRILKTLRLNKLNRSAAIPGLNRDDVYRIRIHLPPLDDQIRIATLLSRVETLIATRKDNLRLLDEFLKSTFLEMFGDPVRNEKGFEVRDLNEFYIDPKNGTKCGPFGSVLKKNEYVKSGVPVWNMDNISKDGRLQPHVNLWITDDKFEELKGYSVINGDVIISRAGTVGKMCVLKTIYPKSIISTNLIRVRFGKDLLPLYFVSLMTYCKGRVGKLRTGPDGTFTHMNTGILDKVHFPYPPTELQNQFVSVAEKVEALKTLYQQNLNELENLYGALSQKAFKGELDLSRIPLAKVPEKTVSDITTQPTDQFAKLDRYAMSDSAGRKHLLHQLFDAFIAERKGASFSLDDFWPQAEQTALDHMDDESPPLGVEDYDMAKTWLFELLKSGQVDQNFDREKNRMELSIK